MAPLNFLKICYKQLVGQKEPLFTFIPKKMDQLLSMTASENHLKKTKFQELKKETLHKLSLNRIAYIGNAELTEDWTDGYKQAIQDLERYFVIREWAYDED